MITTNLPLFPSLVQTNATVLTPTNALPLVQTNETVIGRLYQHFFSHESSIGTRLLLIVILVVLLHLTVQAIRNISEWLVNKDHAQKSPLGFVTQQPKFVTLIQLIANAATFVLYFVAIGLVLQEFGVKLTGYLASASIIALAISFGSQGLVQDVVISLTLIFSDTMDVGDMVEITGATTTVIGHVEEIGLRFTMLRNFFNQIVFIPNRTIGNVSRFPHGGVFAYADVQIPAGADQSRAVQTVGNIATGIWMQFGAIILSQPVIGRVETAPGGGWDFVRVHFIIWPGQGNLIETTFRQQIINAMKTFNPDYAEWQVTVTYRAMTTHKTAKPPLESTPGKPPG
jgi:moderate conductance mechanosensitive channel